MITWHEVLLRLAAALLLCGLIGLQRYISGKEAGMRTHILVGVGAAIFTLVSGYAFHTTAANADRIAAQVVTGIGFIGGGAILKEGTSVRGLTTAAGLWAVASIGMATGAGLWSIALLGTAAILVTLMVLRWIERFLPRNIPEQWTVRVELAGEAEIEPVRHMMAQRCRRATLEVLETTSRSVDDIRVSALPASRSRT